MLRLILCDTNRVKQTYPEVDQMPKGFICPGFDIELMKPLAVLKYLCGVTTQWSCQGNHKKYLPRTAYILLPTEQQFPADLMAKLESSNFFIGVVDDYYEDGSLKINSKGRHSLRSTWNKNCSESELEFFNSKLLKLLNEWANQKIKEHLVYIKKDPFVKEIEQIYKAA